MKNKAHLTLEGLEQIRKLKLGMNTVEIILYLKYIQKRIRYRFQRKSKRGGDRVILEAINDYFNNEGGVYDRTCYLSCLTLREGQGGEVDLSATG